MRTLKPRLLLGAAAGALLAAAAIFVFTQTFNRSGSQLKPGKIEVTENGTIYHLQDGWLIEGEQKENGSIADRSWLVLIANRERGTQFKVFQGAVEWKSEDGGVRSTKGDFRDSPIEGARWVSGVNVTEPKMTTGMSIDNDVLAAVRREPSKHSAYDLYELQGSKVERPTP